MRIVVYRASFPPQLWKRQREEKSALDVQNQPTGGTKDERPGWQPRQLPRFQLNRATWYCYYQNTERASSAPPAAEGGPGWRRPITFQPLPQINYGWGGFRAEIPETAPDQAGLEGKYGWKPNTLYNSYKPNPRIFQQNPPIDESAPVEPDTSQPWTRPITYEPWPVILYRFPDHAEPQGPGANTSQFTVFWQYRTRYEDTALQFVTHFLIHRGNEFDGPGQVVFKAPATFTPKPLWPQHLPTGLPYSYWQPAQDTNAPVEVETLLSWTPKPLTLSRLPRGLVYYLFQATANDFSVPVSTQTVGRVTGLEHRPVHWPSIIR